MAFSIFICFKDNLCGGCRKGALNKAMACALHFCYLCLHLSNWHTGAIFTKLHTPVLLPHFRTVLVSPWADGGKQHEKMKRQMSWVRKGNRLSHGGVGRALETQASPSRSEDTQAQRKQAACPSFYSQVQVKPKLEPKPTGSYILFLLAQVKVWKHRKSNWATKTILTTAFT